MALKFLNDGFFDGKVGIGTDSPTAQFHVLGQDATFYSGTATQQMNIGRNAGERIEIFIDDNTNKIRAIQDSEAGVDFSFILDRSIVGTDLDAVHNFEIQKDGASQVLVNKNGNVGIGTTSPTEKLEVDGNVQIGSTTDAKLFMVSSGGNGYNERFFIQAYAEGGGYGGGFKLSTRNDSNVFNTAVTVNRNGNVGIGETDPGEKLDVKGGNIRLVDASAGLIFTSPNGKLWKQTISNTGVPVYTDVSP